MSKLSKKIKSGAKAKIVYGKYRGHVGSIKSVDRKNLTIFFDDVCFAFSLSVDENGKKLQRSQSIPIPISSVMLIS